MNRQSTEDCQGSENTLYELLRRKFIAFMDIIEKKNVLKSFREIN